MVHSHTYDYAREVKELIGLLHKVGLPTNFEFTSIQVNSNATILRHRDKNSSMSYTASTGDFEGGLLIADEKVIDTFRNLVLFDGSKEHFVTPHTGQRWSLVLFEHNNKNGLDEEQKAFLRNNGFRMHDNSVSEVEDKDPTDEAMNNSLAEARHKVIAIEWTSALLPATFALSALGYEGRSLIVSADSELIEMLPKIKCNVKFVGSPCENIVENVLTELRHDRDMVPLIFADFTSPSIQRQLSRGKTDSTLSIQMAKNLHALIEAIDDLDQGQTRVVVRSDKMEDLPEAFLECLSRTLGVLPWTIRSSDFTPLQGNSTLWFRGNVFWPEKTMINSDGQVPMIKPPKDFEFIVNGDSIVLPPWRRASDKLFPLTFNGAKFNIADNALICSTNGGSRKVFAGEMERIMSVPHGGI